MKVGVVGLVCMGASISRRLMKAGHVSAFLFARFRSGKQCTFAETVLAALRLGYGEPAKT